MALGFQPLVLGPSFSEILMNYEGIILQTEPFSS